MMFKKLLNPFKKRPVLSGVLVLVIIVIVIFFLLGTRKAPLETMAITRGEFLNEVSASGKVIAAQNSTLGFDQSGRIAAINASVGDEVIAGTILTRIDNSSIAADVAQRQASLDRERADLAALYRGTRPEQLAITEQKYTDASSALIIAMNDAYLEVEDAVLDDIDSMFQYGNSPNPNITIRTTDQDQERAIENERLSITRKLSEWKKALVALGASSAATDISSARSVGVSSIQAVETFIAHMATIAADMSVGNSGLTQSEIDSYRSTINGAGQSVSTARSAEQTSYASWAVASNNLALEASGSTPEEVAAQEAQVKAAEAELAVAQANLRKTLVVAPFDGIVTKMDVKVGQIVSPGDASIAMIGKGLFEIESFIPEVNISRVSVGIPAIVSLDAYGPEVEFDATVVATDPAETVRDGVSTYKTTLRFLNDDPRIKSGMTANIRIIAERNPDAIVIPKSIIEERDGLKLIRIKIGESTEERSIETGGSTALGQVEVISGLSEGDIILIPPLR